MMRRLRAEEALHQAEVIGTASGTLGTADTRKAIVRRWQTAAGLGHPVQRAPRGDPATMARAGIGFKVKKKPATTTTT